MEWNDNYVVISRTPEEWAAFTQGYVAQDSRGTWRVFQYEPTFNRRKGCYEGVSSFMIPNSLVDYDSNWEDSLTAPGKFE